MSAADLARRMGVIQQSVVDMERSEQRGTIKVETLQRAADALDCDLVYFLIPRRGLDEMVRRQATDKAARHLGWVSQHSRLEDQALSREEDAAMLDDLWPQFVDRRGLWSPPPADASSR